MKTCTCCKVEKPLSDFYADKRYAFGVANYCKTCTKLKVAAWAEKNRDRSNDIKRRWKAAHPEQNKAVNRACAQANPEIYKAKNKRWRENNPERYEQLRRESILRHQPVRTAAENRRRASQAMATPSWLTEDDYWMMQEAYRLARLRQKICGGKWHVDHIVPLRGKTVTGLHVPWNLQVIPATANIRKSNSHA